LCFGSARVVTIAPIQMFRGSEIEDEKKQKISVGC